MLLRAFVDSRLVRRQGANVLKMRAAPEPARVFVLVRRARVLSHRLSCSRRPRTAPPCVYAPREVALARGRELPSSRTRRSVHTAWCPGRAPCGSIVGGWSAAASAQPLSPAGDWSLRTTAYRGGGGGGRVVFIAGREPEAPSRARRSHPLAVRHQAPSASRAAPRPSFVRYGVDAEVVRQTSPTATTRDSPRGHVDRGRARPPETDR